eukprot:977553-Prymnesium_polylepis.1
MAVRAVAVHPPSPPDVSSSCDAAGDRPSETETPGGSAGTQAETPMTGGRVAAEPPSPLSVS